MSVTSSFSKPLFSKSSATTTLTINEETKIDGMQNKQGLNRLKELWELGKKEEYNEGSEQDRTPESFERNLKTLEIQMSDILKYELVSLAGEVDSGGAAVEKFKEQMENAEREIDANYANRIQILKGEIDATSGKITHLTKEMELIINRMHDNSMAATDLPTLVTAIQKEQDAIVRCSARLAVLKQQVETMEEQTRARMGGSQIGKEEASYAKDRCTQALKQGVMKFRAQRKRDLEKRESDDTKFGGSSSSAVGNRFTFWNKS